MNLAKNRIIAAGIVFAMLALPQVVTATPIFVTGQGEILPVAPADTDGGSPDPDVAWQLGFAEQSGVLLEEALMVDGGSIEAGYVVDSTMIFFETASDGKSYAEATWSFAGSILGVMSDTDGALMAMSDALLGATGTFYPGETPNRGLDGGDWYDITNSGYSLDLGMWVAEPGDWIRVITASVEPTVIAVTEPAIFALFAFGLVGLGLARRRPDAARQRA